jgi:hypothetical protein
MTNLKKTISTSSRNAAIVCFAGLLFIYLSYNYLFPNASIFTSGYNSIGWVILSGILLFCGVILGLTSLIASRLSK